MNKHRQKERKRGQFKTWNRASVSRQVSVATALFVLVGGGCGSERAEISSEAEFPSAVAAGSASLLLPPDPISDPQSDEQNSGNVNSALQANSSTKVDKDYLSEIKPGNASKEPSGYVNSSVQDNREPARTSSTPPPNLESEESKGGVEYNLAGNATSLGYKLIPEEEMVLDEEVHYGLLNDIPEKYHHLFDIVVPSEPRNEVLVTSLGIRECVARGYVHNLSDSMIARHVVVTLESLDGIDKATWKWSLTLMPGERAPFEIEVDWVPSRLPTNQPNSRASSSGMRNFWREPMSNLVPSATADFSTEIDISRAFVRNVDGSRDPERNFELLSYAFDYHLYGLEEWESALKHTRNTSLMSSEQFDLLHSQLLAVSAQVDTVLEELVPLHYSDWYYIPSEVFPKQFDVDTHSTVTDIRIFYAATSFDHIFDVQELIPFQVIQEADGDSLQRRIVASSISFGNFGSDETVPTYTIVPRPEIVAEIVGPSPVREYHRHIDGKLWVGKAESRMPLWASVADNDKLSGEEHEGRGWPRGSCDRQGRLTREDYDIKTGVWADVFDATFGYFGLFKNFQSFSEIEANVFVDPFSVSAEDGYVRGLVHNASDSLFVRDLSVNVERKSALGGSGRVVWPLTVQPGERAPFEIYIGGWTGALPNSEFVYEVSASLSERVDISRSFRIHEFAAGSVYADEINAQAMESFLGIGDYIIEPNPWYSYSHISFDAYNDTYGSVSCQQDLEISELRAIDGIERTVVSCGGEDGPFGYVDLYAHISIPDSHPTLSGPISTQTIRNLRAYVALVDAKGVVSDVKAVTLFTSGYSKETLDQEYIPVNAIPAPNLLDPGAVRILFTRPQFKDSPWEDDYSYQVWIGGANDA